MGLWLLNESIRTWELAGTPVELKHLLHAAANPQVNTAIFDVEDESFLTPGDMPKRIGIWLRNRGLRVPVSRAELTRSILMSLAESYTRVIRTATELSGKTIRVVHIVGGGSQNSLLCQLTADATGLPVIAGPTEATAIGNVLVQARSLGWLNGDLETLRAVVIHNFKLNHYKPNQNPTPQLPP